MRWCLNRWRGRAALLVVLSALAGPAHAGPDDGPTKDAASGKIDASGNTFTSPAQRSTAESSSLALYAAWKAATISTFSCDTDYSLRPRSARA